MKKFVITSSVVAILGSIVIAAFSLFFIFLSWHNQANILKNQYEMKVKDNMSQFDNTWKSIQQAAKVPEQKKAAFAEIFSSYAQNRSGGGDHQMMTWIKEAVPNVDLSVYDQMVNIVVGSRNTWTMKQTELVSIAEQYNMLLAVQPKGFILNLFGHNKIDPKIVTSSRTDESFESGKDDDISL